MSSVLVVWLSFLLFFFLFFFLFFLVLLKDLRGISPSADTRSSSGSSSRQAYLFNNGLRLFGFFCRLLFLLLFFFFLCNIIIVSIKLCGMSICNQRTLFAAIYQVEWVDLFDGFGLSFLFLLGIYNFFIRILILLGSNVRQLFFLESS